MQETVALGESRILQSSQLAQSGDKQDLDVTKTPDVLLEINPERFKICYKTPELFFYTLKAIFLTKLKSGQFQYKRHQNFIILDEGTEGKKMGLAISNLVGDSWLQVQFLSKTLQKKNRVHYSCINYSLNNNEFHFF